MPRGWVAAFMKPIRTAMRRVMRLRMFWSSAQGLRAFRQRSLPGRAGARVLLAEQDSLLGGSLLLESASSGDAEQLAPAGRVRAASHFRSVEIRSEHHCVRTL